MATKPKVITTNDVYTIIDPNPENHVIDHEDLFIYASLKAKTKGRTFLTEDTTINNNDELDTIEIKSVDLIISDSAKRGEDKRQFLTTNWTEIGGSQFTDVNNRGDVEGFGITNVDIKVEGSYIPVVTIDFVDIRGATLFEQGSCSPYGLFFHLPYPVFELTVKGYYGKPVTYYLNLVKFNTKFNSETGNFEARGEFIGWSYAFLADILMGFVRCANYMDEGWGAQKSLRNKYDEAIKYYIDNGLYDESNYLTEDTSKAVTIEGRSELQPFCWQTEGGSTRCMTITDLLKKIDNVEEFLGRVKTDNQYTEVTNLIRVSNELIRMREALRNFNRQIISPELINYIKEIRPTTASGVNENTLFVFNAAPDKKLKDTLKNFFQRPIEEVPTTTYGSIVAQIPAIKETLVTAEDVTLRLYGGSYVGVGSQTNVSPPDGIATKTSVSGEGTQDSFQMFSKLDEVFFQNGMMNSDISDEDGNQLFNYDDVGGEEFFIDTGHISKIINDDLNTINEELEKRRNNVKNEIDEGVIKRLGFRPTIRNVFTILSCNVENFMQLLLKCSIQAEEYHRQRKAEYNSQFSSGDRRLNEVRNSSADEQTGQNVYPWPTYYETKYTSNTSSNGVPQTKEVYPGQRTDFYDWWEVRFVEDFIKACEKVNKEDEALLENKTGIPGYDNYTPINPLESKIIDGGVQLKYRESVTLPEESDITTAVNKFIAERMFITMDFSYYDPIRLNLLNFGLGHNIPKRKAANKDKAQSLEDFNKQRLWFHTLYNNNNKVIETIAKIDANNLLSTIDDTSILDKLNLEIGSGVLKDKIEATLKSVTDNVTQSNGSDSWFNTGVDYTDIFERFNDPSPSYKDDLKSVMDKNLDDIIGYDKNNKYWAYHPKDGYIRFLGRGSRSFGDENENNAVKIYTDIRKMKENYLFRLIDENELDNIFKINYNEDNKQDNKKLNEELSERILDGVKTFDCSDKYVNYSLNEVTKLLQFDGSNDDDGKGLFTTLNIGVSKYDEGENKTGSEQEKYSIKYAGIPTFVTNNDSNQSGKYVSGYYKKESVNFLFMQQTYQNYGRKGDFSVFEPEFSKGNGATNDPAGSTSVPAGFTLEIPGKGIFENVTVYESDGETQLNPYSEDGTPQNIQNKVDETPFSNPAYSLLPSNNSSIGDRYKEWGSTFVADNLIQLPIWLDNVNIFRKATTSNGVDGDDRGLNELDSNMWGSNRPLTSDNDKLKSPQIGQVITTYGDKGKKVNDSSDTNLAYDSEQIQNRNLAYLFLASCKPTPLITCGLAEPHPGVFGESVFGGGAPAVFTFKDEHYPKSIIPFITSQGLVKIPKVWVYGIGSVLWRWKMYMGCNTDSKGNILWRHPIFGEKPIGLDPLAQPGHPGYTENDLSRKERSNSTSNTPQISYVNKLFNGEKGWFTSDVDNQNHIQTSCFASTTIRNIGENRSLSGGRLNSGTDYGSPKPYRISHGCNFDYWGVYNADQTLISNGIPNSILMPKRNNAFYGEEGADSNSPWVTLAWHFIRPSDAKGGPLTKDQFIADFTDKYKEKYNPLDLGFRSAKEASANTFWPLLWITPWQHFYTEPISSTSLVGPKLPSPDKKKNSINEKTLTFIPVDHKFRDYVGNFGALGDKTSNFANRTLGATTQQTTFTITNEFSLPNENNEFSDKTINVSYVTYQDFGLDTWVNLEGGRYAELIALLPTFIKEKFVEEFEKWVDTKWSSDYLKVIDPVNFDGDCKTDCLAKSYRIDSFIDDKYAFNKILGQRSSEIYLNPWNSVLYEDPGVGVVSLNTDTSNSDKIKLLETNLFNQYYYAMVATPRVFGLDWHDYQEGTPFYANETLVEKYLTAFQVEWKERYPDTKKNIQENDEDFNNDTILDDSDIKLSLYRSFKSITDKWISSTTEVKSNTPNFFFNITGNGLNEEKTPLAGHFSYVNRVMGEIGNRSVLDVIKLKELPNNPKMSFYNLISDLLGENNFDFFPLPTFTNFTGGDYKGNADKRAEDMFSPYTNMVEPKSGPNFICMYVGGTSRTLDLKPKANCPIDQIDMDYNDDGFSLSNEEDKVNIPHEYQNPEEALVTTPSSTGNRIENGGITAFRVAYGIENQNMFKSIELDQTEFSETNESLLVIDRLANGGDPANRTQKGNNLHNVYLTRSYTCKVESLGNMMIQPLQYFDLTNVPMFYGTYLITKVEHNIKPHHITTNFTGVRQPIATVPIVEDISVALNNSIKNVKAIEGGAGFGAGGRSGAGAGGGVVTTSTVTGEPVSIDGIDFIDFGNGNYLNQLRTRSDGQGKDGRTPAFNREVDTIVLHWTAGYTFDVAINTLKTNGLHYHFIAHENGSLYQTSDLTLKAWHAGGACSDDARGHDGLNSKSIGISYVGGVENGDTNNGYVRTLEEWNSEEISAPNGRKFKSKKQFGALVKACLLAKQQHPNIKYITSHHWTTTRKIDVGDAFPWNILLNKLRELDSSFNDVEIWYQVPNNCGGGGLVRQGASITTQSGDIDLDLTGGALAQELDGNGPEPQGQAVDGIPIGTGVTPASGAITTPNGVQGALNYAGQI